MFAIDLAPADGPGLNWLYEHTEVIQREADAEGVSHVIIRVVPERTEQIIRRFSGARILQAPAAPSEKQEAEPYRP